MVNDHKIMRERREGANGGRGMGNARPVDSAYMLRCTMDK